MNIVLTGGSGFIGSHLSQELLKNSENKLIIVDNLLTGNLDNIQDLLDNENATFIQHDVQAVSYTHLTLPTSVIV